MEIGAKKRILGIGRVVEDHVVVLPAYPVCDTKNEVVDQWQQVGGPVAVAVSTACFYGTATTFLGSWGPDEAGRRIEAELQRRGIDIQYCHQDGTTGYAQIWAEMRTGTRTIAYRGGSDIPSDDLSQYDAAIEQDAIVHLDGSSARVARYLAQRSKDQNGIVVLDAGSKKPGMEDLFAYIDILVASDLFCQSWFGKVDVSLAQLRDLGCAAVIRTRGEQGTLYFDGERELHEPAMKIQPVDTNGAGDVFCGGLLRGLAENWDITESLRFANRVAGYKCARKGNTSLPSDDEVR